MNDSVVRARVEANVSSYQRGMADAGRATEDFRREAEAAARPMTGLQAVFNRLSSGAAAVARFVPGLSVGFAALAAGALGLATNSAAVADEIGRMAEQVGISAREMSEYRYAAQVAGMSTGALTSGLSALSDAIQEDSAALQAMGVATRGASGDLRPLGDVLRDVADRFQGYESGAAKAKLGSELFGGSIDDWLPILNRGGAGLSELTGEAERFGLVVSDQAAAEARAFTEDLNRLKGMLPALIADLGGPLVGALRDLAEEFIEARRAGLGFMDAVFGIRTSNPFSSYSEHIADIEGKLDKIRNGAWYEKPWNVLGGKEEEARLERMLQYYRSMANLSQARQNRDLLAGFDDNPLGYSSSAGAVPEVPGKPKRPRAGRTPRAQAYVDPLADEARAYQSAMQSLVSAQREAETSSWGLTETQRKLLDVMTSPAWMTMPDAMRATIAEQAEATIAAEQMAASQRRLNELLGTDKLEKQRADMQLLADAFLAGSINADEYSGAVQRALGNLPPVLDETKDAFADLKRAIEGWGDDSARAMVDFALTGKGSFSDMVDSMLADMARMVVQKNVTGPLAAAVGSFDWGSMFGFANGGVMTGAGPLPLRTYSAGGIANSPQLALFGEGRMNEAYVPLPDGRSIPVTMSGGGGVQSVRVEIRNEGSQKMRVAEAQPRFDVDGMVVQVVLRDLNNNGPIRQKLGSM